VTANLGGVLSALLMFSRFEKTMRYAFREEDFGRVLGAGALLVLLGQGWSVVDALYFAVSTLTTTSVSDPDLVLDDAWAKIFTVFYQLIGIGILVEILRRLGFAFVAIRAEEREAEPAEEDAGT
jgi:hypothetical protein